MMDDEDDSTMVFEDVADVATVQTDKTSTTGHQTRSSDELADSLIELFFSSSMSIQHRKVAAFLSEIETRRTKKVRIETRDGYIIPVFLSRRKQTSANYNETFISQSTMTTADSEKMYASTFMHEHPPPSSSSSYLAAVDTDAIAFSEEGVRTERILAKDDVYNGDPVEIVGVRFGRHGPFRIFDLSL